MNNDITVPLKIILWSKICNFWHRYFFPYANLSKNTSKKVAWFNDVQKHNDLSTSIASRSGRTLAYSFAYLSSNHGLRDTFNVWLANSSPIVLLTLAGDMCDPFKCRKFHALAPNPVFYCSLTPRHLRKDDCLLIRLARDVVMPHDMPVCVLGLLSPDNPFAANFISQALGGPSVALAELGRLESFIQRCAGANNFRSPGTPFDNQTIVERHTRPYLYAAARRQLNLLIEQQTIAGAIQSASANSPGKRL